MLNIVLHEPEIPANTGNIGRTCVATNTRLHLIEPLGFRLNEKNLKRAGMDYWEHLDVRTYIDYNDFLEKNPGAKIYMATTKETSNGVSYSLLTRNTGLYRARTRLGSNNRFETYEQPDIKALLAKAGFDTADRALPSAG